MGKKIEFLSVFLWIYPSIPLDFLKYKIGPVSLAKKTNIV